MKEIITHTSSAQRRSECRWGNMTAQIMEVVHILVPLTGEGIQADGNRIGYNSTDTDIYTYIQFSTLYVVVV